MLLKVSSTFLLIASLMSVSMASRVTEGHLNFEVASIGRVTKTWYKIIGDLEPQSRPFIALHGGPGVTSGYLELLSDITNSKNSRGPLIVYDQIGNGLSTHLPELAGNTTFWTEQLFLDELNNLIKKLKIKEYDLLGHSWGGMMASRHASFRPPGLKHLVLMSTPASMPLWIEGVNRLRAQLPEDVRDILDHGEETGDMESPEYQEAVAFFYARHLITIDPIPEAIAEGFAWIARDPTVYLTMSVSRPFIVHNVNPHSFPSLFALQEWSERVQCHRQLAKLDNNRQHP